MTPALWASLIGAVVLLLTNTAALIKVFTDNAKIKMDRAETKSSREKDSRELHDKVLKLEFQSLANKDNTALLFTKYDDLATQLRLLVVELTKLSTELSSTNKQLQTFQSMGKQ